ncbi:sigma-70 family RNA polymerase sigma factor [Nakamurella alba]|uniref:sigma-70 family RNA polymerase sigma factor n=1 Tax=Nakamurella alba TaxID=2665158 RepID=UPI0018A94EC2|nr:sigma-70 family RNA polymerase sigma factor [Nakamurella alba]
MGPDELERLVTASGDRLLRLALQLTHQHAAAQDLVQQALLHLLRSRVRLDADSENAYRYARKAVVHAHISGHRRLVRLMPTVSGRLPEPQRTIDDPADRIVDADLVWTSLMTLPDRQRAVLVLRYFEDLADPDIARILGCRRTTVRSLAARGLATLRHLDALGTVRPARPNRLASSDRPVEQQ